MKIRNIMFILIASVFFAGCGDNNSDAPTKDATNSEVGSGDNTVDTNGTVSLVMMDGSSMVLTENSQQVSINMKVLNTDNSPYFEGNVTVAYPDKVQSNVDVGSFESSNVEVGEEGRVTFNYTAPENLQERVEQGDTSTVFGFYHNSEITSIKYFTFKYEPVENQKVLTNYSLKESSSSSLYTMNLDDIRQTSYSVENNDGTKLDDEDIISMKITVKNPLLAELRDSIGNSGSSLSFEKRNNVSVNLKSNTKSGVVPIEVEVSFVDVNGETQSLLEVFNFTIFSGPPTAMSISYSGTEYDASIAKFKEKMVISVTDKYFNPVNTQPAAAAYMIVGYALEDQSDPESRLFFRTSDPEAGTMNPSTNSLTSSADFSNLDLNNEFLLTYAQGYTYNVSGKWDIASKVGGKLTLSDTVEAQSSVSNIGFAIGHNYREVYCDDTEGAKIGNVVLLSDRLDVNGMVDATINYDYYLTGKSVTLGVEIIGYTAETDTTSKFGQVVKHTLRSTGLVGSSCSVPSGAVNHQCRLRISIEDAPEWYRNARMGYDIVTSDNVSLVSFKDSNDAIFDCDQTSGVAYVDVVVDENEAKAGTVSLERVLVADEF